MLLWPHKISWSFPSCCLFLILNKYALFWIYLITPTIARMNLSVILIVTQSIISIALWLGYTLLPSFKNYYFVLLAFFFPHGFPMPVLRDWEARLFIWLLLPWIKISIFLDVYTLIIYLTCNTFSNLHLLFLLIANLSFTVIK